MTNYRRKRRPQKDNNLNKIRINKQIKYPLVKVIDDSGLVGIMSSNEALDIAVSREMDLIEINPKGEPPVVKILDFNKYKYQQSKSDVIKKAKPLKEKTIRVSVRIGPHDLLVQAKKTDQFVVKGHKVKIQVQMERREKAHPEVAQEMIGNFIKLISVEYEFVQEPKLIGDSYYCTIKPK